MSDALRELRVLALDGQAGGATPAYGDLLELGWAPCAHSGLLAPVHSCWIVPRTRRPIPRAVRELTGWTEACVAEAVDEAVAWCALREQLASLSAAPAAVPTVIHFARFELAFLRDLHARLGGGEEFPFDVVCLHAIAERLFPDLPRRNIRALAGHLGHSPELTRRSGGHVEATAFLWSALVPLLEQAGVASFGELKDWLATPLVRVRRARRVFPLAPERRRALPDRPGIYRFLRRNGDVLYVGKAVSLKKRVASHFKSSGPATERGLELLSQVHDVQCTETASLVEAALLESDEIKRLDPPYNVQLRAGERSVWFASRDLREVSPTPDDEHRIGPLPSRGALVPLAALIALLEGADAPRLRAGALAVPAAFLPETALFDEGFRLFAAEHLAVPAPSAQRRVTCAARSLWLQRGRAEPEPAEPSAPDAWDLARVRRRLERNLVQSGLLLRRTRWLCLLADGDIAFRERSMSSARVLVVSRGEIVAQRELASVAELAGLSPRRPVALRQRLSAFDAAAYDRLRVLLTELRRVQEEGGETAAKIGVHALGPEQLARFMRSV
jgi:DNA polymerase-3 subunit epsilon